MDDLEAKEKFGQMDVSTLFIVQRLANDFSNIGLHSHLMNNIVLKWIRPLLVCAVCTQTLFWYISVKVVKYFRIYSYSIFGFIRTLSYLFAYKALSRIPYGSSKFPVKPTN